jgi:TonB family protein
VTRFLALPLLWLTCCRTSVWSQDATQAPIQVPPDSVPTLLLRKVAPVYPPLARQARIQGTVVLSIVISKEGEVRNTKLVSGHPMLAPAAIDAVKQWRYKPYISDDKPVEVETVVRVGFKMPDEPPVRGVVGDMPGGFPPELAQVGHVRVCESALVNATPRRIRVSQGAMQSLVIAKPAPDYPTDARSQHVEGTVLLDVEIGKDGSVCDVALISGHPLLAPAAADGVRQWKYRSYLLNGQPIEVETKVQVNFKLAGGAELSSPLGSHEQSGLPMQVPKRVRVSAGVMKGLLDHKVDPEYPADAKEKHIEGAVVLNVDVDREGNVGRVELVSGHPMLAPAAMDAVLQWKYRPFVLNREAVAVETTVQLQFAPAGDY